MRRIFILLCCIVLMIALAVSASAVSYGWEDFVTGSGTTDSGLPWAECKFPSSMGRIDVYNGSTLLEGVTGGSVTRSWSAGEVPHFTYFPLGVQGTSAFGVGKLALKSGNNPTFGIPNGTKLYFDLDITASAASLSNATITAAIHFYTYDQRWLDQTIIDLVPNGSLPYVFAFDYTVNAPIDAWYMSITIDLNSNVALSSSTSIGIYASDLWMRGDGLLYHDWKVSIDDINQGINGDSNPIDPDNLPSGDLEDQENFFAGLGEDIFGSLAEFFDTAVNFLLVYGHGFLVISALFSSMLEFEIVGFLLNLSISLGILGFVLNITPSIVDKFDRNRVERNKFREWQESGGKRWPK